MKSSRGLGLGLVLALGALVAAACNSAAEGEGSETHFVCEVDADCADQAGTVCVAGECVEPPNGAGGGDGGGDSGGVPRTTNIFVDTISHKTIDKIDLLFMIDNSSSMSDKQAVLRDAVPDLVKRLVNPQCVDPVTHLPRGGTPDDPAAPCSDPGAVREFVAIKDVHVGVITSSLGGHGSAACEPRAGATPLRTEMEDDRAELIGARPRFAGGRSPEGQVASPEGFLDWNPAASGGQDIVAFNVAFQDMMTAAGAEGCEYEAQLESIYRFLVDPAPPMAITLQPCGSNPLSGDCATSTGINQALLAQRTAFLRPDSLVAIVMLTDENDCSIRDSGQHYLVARPETELVASSPCETDPNDACCYSCLVAPPFGCAADPACEQLNPQVDPPSLRCFDQKRRFGIDFLYPTQRYVNALRNPEICPEAPDLVCAGGTPVANPLFANPGGLPRDPSLVFLAGIVGVPWQDLRANTVIDREGNEQSIPLNELRYIKSSDPRMAEVWPVILGADGAPPRDALMRESIYRRGGDGPIAPGIGALGQIMPEDYPLLANPANGHEYVNAAADDLQYACIFRLAEPRDCAAIGGDGCDCTDAAVADMNPLCQADDGSYSRVQRYGKAYPGIRELQVLKDFGDNSIVASICARNLTDANAQDYGYRPAVDAIVERLNDALFTRCLPRRLEADEQGNVPCSLIEALPAGTCDPSQGRSPADERHMGPARARLEQRGQCGQAGQPSCDSFTLCELARADDTCLQNVPYDGTPGWCYVDPLPPEQGGQSLGDPSIVALCPTGEKRLLRFVDPEEQTPAPAATVLILCEGADLE